MKNVLYVNNTREDLRMYHTEIAASLKAGGALPEELADLFTVTKTVNPDGSPRYIIDLQPVY